MNAQMKKDVFENASHPLLADLLKNKTDQVASIIAAGMSGWLVNSHPWVGKTEARYDRTNKGRSVTFSIFSNGGELIGKPVKEEPFFQIEVDRFTKQLPVCEDLPIAFGLCESIFNHSALRDMAYPYLFIITVLMRYRNYMPVNLYFDEGTDRPLQLELVGGQCIWRIMLWQNRLINEYNEIIKACPKLATPSDGKYAEIQKLAAEHRNSGSLAVNLEDEELKPIELK